MGSLVGGFLYKKIGGAATLRIFSILAAISSVMYLILHVAYLKHVMPQTKPPKSPDVEWKSPEEAKRDVP